MIRQANLKDFSQIISLIKLNLDAFSKHEIPAARRNIKELIKKHNRAGNFFVYVSSNKIVGCAGYHKSEETVGVYSFNWLAVHPDFKRHGIATRLYNHIEKKIRFFRARLVIVNAGTGEINRFFYRKMGFKTCGKIPKYYSNKKDLIWYYKAIIP